MTRQIISASSLLRDLQTLGVVPGDGVFVHASMRAIGIGGARVLTETLLTAVGPDGLVGMPAFSSDAYFPSQINVDSLSSEMVAEIAAGLGEGLRSVAGAVVSHDAGYRDAETGVVGDSRLEEGDGAFLALIE